MICLPSFPKTKKRTFRGKNKEMIFYNSRRTDDLLSRIVLPFQIPTLRIQNRDNTRLRTNNHLIETNNRRTLSNLSFQHIL